MGAPALGAWHPGMSLMCLPIDGCRMPRPYSLTLAMQPVGFSLTPDRPHPIIDPPIGRGTAFGRKSLSSPTIDRPNAAPLAPDETFPISTPAIPVSNAIAPVQSRNVPVSSENDRV